MPREVGVISLRSVTTKRAEFFPRVRCAVPPRDPICVLHLTRAKIARQVGGRAMNDGEKQHNDSPIVVALIAAGATIIAVPIIVMGLIGFAWRFVLQPWSARQRPIVSKKIKQTAETVERFIGPQQT